MLISLGSWFTGLLGPLLWGIVRELLAQYLRNRALVNAGAAQQREADRVANQKIAETAKERGDALAQKSDDDVARDFARWVTLDDGSSHPG